ncbi:unnamed protein product [Polarella glacialis]|nr:unnamed protein product [Polarella glacialis]
MFCLGLVMMASMHPVFPIALWGLDKAGPILLERSGLLGTDVDEPGLSKFQEAELERANGSLVVPRSLQLQQESSGSGTDSLTDEQVTAVVIAVVIWHVIYIAIFFGCSAGCAFGYKCSVTDRRVVPFQVPDEWNLQNNGGDFRFPLLNCF